jgi:WD40 repeat protein
MRTLKRSSILLATLVVAAAAPASIAHADDKVTYQDHVLPLFRNSCLNCHNPDKKKAGLDLSTFAGAMAGGGTGKAIEPGDPDGSLLFRLVKHDEEPSMPPKSDKLPEKDLDLIKRWIAGGVLESSGSTAVASSKPKVDLTVQVAGKPAGKPVMPGDLLLEPTVRTTRAGAVLAMASSPWAPLVAVGGQKQVLLYNSKSLELLGVLPFPEGFPNVLRFSHSGKLLLVAGGVGAKSGKAVLFDIASGNRVTEVGDELDSVLAADISPDQTTVALGGPSRVVKLFSTANGAMTAKIKKHTDWVTAVAFSPDGKLLATGDRNGGLFVWEAESANEAHNLPGHKAAVTSLRFRGDGNLLASGGEDGRVVLWNMADGKLAKDVKANQPGVLSLDFAPDGRLVTAGRDNVLRTWKPDGAALKSFPKFDDVALHAVFDQSDGGKRIIGADWTGAVRVFDAEQANKPLGTLDPNPPAIAERVAKVNAEVSERQASCDKAAMEFFRVEEELARATVAHQAAEHAIANSSKLEADAEASVAAVENAIADADAGFGSAKSSAADKRDAAEKALQAAIAAKSAQDAANAEYEALSTDAEAMREDDGQRALGEKSKQLAELGDATAKALEAAAIATKDRTAAQQSLDAAREAVASAKRATADAAESLAQARRIKQEAPKSLAESAKRMKQLSADIDKLKPRVAHVAAEFAEAKQALARLKAGAFFTQVYAARQELATRKAEFDAADGASKAAKAAAEKAVADVPAFEKRTTEFPQRIAAAERAIPVAERMAAVAANVAKGLVEIQAEREAFLKQTAAQADKLAGMSGVNAENKLLADAAAAARNTADLLAQELEKFKAGIKTQDRAAKDAADAVAAAKANLEQERADEKNAPQILASLRAAVAPAQAEAAEKAQLADAASKQLADAKSKSDELELRYAELKKQLGLPAPGSQTSTASARD